MSRADEIFIEMCKDILENGYSSEGQKVRPVWEDGTPAHTIKKFGVVNRYDLSKEFPILTLRPTPMKLAIDELLWIWQKKSNKVIELNSKVWDSWTDENGTIGKAYGYQLGVKHKYKEGEFRRQIFSQLMRHTQEFPLQSPLKALPGTEFFLGLSSVSASFILLVYMHSSNLY